MSHKEIIAQAQAELAPTASGTVPPAQPQQVKIEDLTDEQLIEAANQMQTMAGTVSLTQRAVSRQLNSLNAELDQLEAKNNAVYAEAQKRGIPADKMPGVRFG